MWVIERYHLCELEYWAGTTLDRKNAWNKKFEAAVKFADYDSGMRVLVDLCEGHGRVTEHQFLNNAA